MLSGGCLCRSIRYEVMGVLNGATACHCSKCRKAFSGAGSTYVQLRPDNQFHWTQGQDELTTFVSEQAWGLGFCKHCGSTLCGMFEGVVHGLTLGCLDDASTVEIGAHIFVASKASWDHIGGGAPQFPNDQR